MIKKWLKYSALFFILPVQAQQNPDWENPGVFQKGQVAPHASLMPYDQLDQALEAQRKSSSNCLLLNGYWDFMWVANPEKAPAGFHLPGFDCSGWDSIRVPSNWQMEGFGYAKFRNIGQPFPEQPPRIPSDFNPVGSYIREFTLPAQWTEKQVFLHFEGVHSASTVWVNGKEVGYNQGGMEPAEYDITAFLQEGSNSLAVSVLRYSDGSYLEDQDTWRLSGIFRDVYLMATPRQHIRDFYIRTDLDGDYRDAVLSVEMDLHNYAAEAVGGLEVRTRLVDPAGSELELSGTEIDAGRIAGGREKKLSQRIEVTGPRLWSAEFPNLYTLVMEVRDAQGQALEFLSQKVGFREVEVRDQALLINGRAVKFNGVNSHMMHPETGHAMDVATMRQDLELMKRFNINCVRTSHYPPNVEYLDLANELGMYIVDECGDEAHAYIHLSSNPDWKEQYLDRMRKMVYRDRNQPSVVIWSAGNESGPGDNICALIAEGKQIDPGRPAWMYGGNRDEDPATNPIRCEDIVGPRYLMPFLLEQRFAKSDDPRPSFMDEYIAATGNSLGGLDDYWELIYKYPRLTGGAIWDWISPGISMPVRLTPDDSPAAIQCALINRASLVDGPHGKALYLSGHDDWLLTYRDPFLDLEGDELSLSFYVRPEPFRGKGDFLCKGDYQFGIVQPEEDVLSFYLNTGQRQELKAKLPGDWEGNWHHVAGIYTGEEMRLYVDGKLAGSQSCSGEIRNSPYWLTLGKSAELRDGHQGYMCHATLDRVRVFDRALDVKHLGRDGGEARKEKARLWLDFEAEEQKGTYWSIGIPGRTYGLVWPDRSIQPELWQLKKSAQPVKVERLEGHERDFRITNRQHFRSLSEVDCHWSISENGKIIREGKVDLDIPAGESALWTMPAQDWPAEYGSVYMLEFSFRTREDQGWAEAGHELAWEQFILEEATTDVDIVSYRAGLTVEEGDDVLVLSGQHFKYSFSKEEGKLISMNIDGKEMLSAGPQLNLWRAPLANDLDSWNEWHTAMGYEDEWMGRETANGWRSVGLDRLSRDVNAFSWEMRGSKVLVMVEEDLLGIRGQTGYKVHYSYLIGGDGEIKLNTRVSSRAWQPRWLPKVGLQMALNKDYFRIEWFGRGPYENYPDRKSGAKIGLYHSTVEEEYVPYIIPQDYGNKCDVRWIRLRDEDGSGLEVRGEAFNTSVQKFSTDQLDRAHYPFQLQEAGEIILNIDHRVSGVGGTALSVLNPYRVHPGDYEFTFTLKPLKN